MAIEQAESEPAAATGRTARRIHLPLVFWLLVALSLVTIAGGVWWLVLGNVGGAPSDLLVPAPRALQPSLAADFELTTLDGRQIRLSDLRGKTVLLNFWATWCPPCKAEMPDLEALYREYGPAHNFVVLAVDVEEDQATVQRFASEYGLTFPVLPDPDGKVSNDRYLIRALPTSFIIDGNGKLRYTWTGQQSRDSMLSRLQNVW